MSNQRLMPGVAPAAAAGSQPVSRYNDDNGMQPQQLQNMYLGGPDQQQQQQQDGQLMQHQQIIGVPPAPPPGVGGMYDPSHPHPHQQGLIATEPAAIEGVGGNSSGSRPKSSKKGNKPTGSTTTKTATAVDFGDTSSAALSSAAIPDFLVETQGTKRKRDPTLPKQTRKRYSKQEKQQIMDILYSNPTGLDGPPIRLSEVAQRFGLPEGTLRGWYDIDRREKERKGITVPFVITGIKDMKAAESSTDGDGGGMSQSDAMNVDDIDPSGKTKQKRQRYSNEKKIQVILALESRPDASLNDVAKEFGVAPGTVRGWREEADKIQKQATENRRIGAKANPSNDPLKRIWDAMLRLYELNSRLPVEQRLDINVAVVRATGRQARDDLLAANEASGQTLLSENEKVNMEKFKSSETWARKWARDHEVISCKLNRNPLDAAQNRMVELQRLISKFPPNNVYTMTSTELYYRALPRRTYVAKVPGDTVTHARVCKGLKSKDRLTLYLCANESGRDKLPIAVVGKYENPPCFQVDAQRKLPYLHQKQALSDAGTVQRWWRSVFLPHIRERHPVTVNVGSDDDASSSKAHAGIATVGDTAGVSGDTSYATTSNKILLLVESSGPCKAELLRDPTGQVRVEEMVPSLGELGANSNSLDGGTSSRLVHCHPFEFEVIQTINRRYRYRLLNEIFESFTERNDRRKVADTAEYKVSSRGLREGEFLHVGDAMRLLTDVWEGIAPTSVARAWQQSKMRSSSKSNVLLNEQQESKSNQRSKSEKRQNNREKKKLMKDLESFFMQKVGPWSHLACSKRLEEEVLGLKRCFTLDTGDLIDTKSIDSILDDWVGLESSEALQKLIVDEIKEEMNIEYLIGLRHPLESVLPEAQEPEDHQDEEVPAGKNIKEETLDPEKALELAATIKKTAVMLFGSRNNLLGDLAVTLDDASAKIFTLLREERDQSTIKEGSTRTKSTSTASNGSSLTVAPTQAGRQNGACDRMGTDATNFQSVPDVAPTEDEDIVGVFDSELGTFQRI